MHEITTIEPCEITGAASSAVITYLGNLKPSGRRTMHRALERLGMLFTSQGGCDPRTIPWHLVRYEHAAAARAILPSFYAPATVNKHLTALRGISRECWRHGLMDGDTLARIVDVPNLKGKRLPAGRMVSHDELRKLWIAADGLGARYGACLALLFSAGLRRSEAACVAHEHLTWATGADGAQTCWIKTVGKGDKERRVPVRGTGACRLRAVEPHNPYPKGLLLKAGCGRSVAKLLERIVRTAGIDHASCHDLRRSFVSHALAGGAPIADVARVAGHADPRTTAGYDRRADDALVGVADALPE